MPLKIENQLVTYMTQKVPYKCNIPRKKLHYKPFTFHFIIYLCPQNKISNNPIHVGLYVGFGGINQKKYIY